MFNNDCLSSRTLYAFPYYQIQNKNCRRKYIINSFINIYFDKTYIELFETDCLYEKQELFFSKIETIFRYRMVVNSNEVDRYLIRQLNSGMSFTCHVDDYFIPGTPNFENVHSDKEILVIKFCEDKKYLAITVIDCKIKKVKISCEQLRNAIISLNNSSVTFIFRKYNNNNHFEIDIDKIKEDIHDYLISKSRFSFFPPDGCLFGSDAVISLIEYIDNRINRFETIDIDNASVLLDHKIMFYCRLKYLEQLKIISDSNLSQKYKKVVDIFKEYTLFCSEYKNLVTNRCLHYKQELAIKKPEIESIVEYEASLLRGILNTGLKT